VAIFIKFIGEQRFCLWVEVAPCATGSDSSFVRVTPLHSVSKVRFPQLLYSSTLVLKNSNDFQVQPHFQMK